MAQELFAQKKALEEAEKSRKILEETVEIQEGERIKIGTPINGKTQSEVLQRLRDGIEESSDNLPPYHRPEPPLDHSFAPPLESTSRIKELCSFFWKTGACIYGDGCSRFHPTPPIDSADLKVLQSSVFCPPCLVLILENMFDNFSLRYDPLEVDESHLQSDYEVFYEDVRPEIEVTCGKISALRCCRNAADHLRGNVYIQLTGDDTTAITAAARLNGRWYAGRQITARLAYLGGGWKAAVCGLYLRDLCPKGDRRCNFLHLFLNPRESSGDLLAALSRGLAELPSRRKEKRRASRKKNQDKDSDGHRRKRRRSPSSRSDSGRRHRNRQKKRHHRRKRG